jgi:hypothetical protein
VKGTGTSSSGNGVTGESDSGSGVFGLVWLIFVGLVPDRPSAVRRRRRLGPGDRSLIRRRVRISRSGQVLTAAVDSGGTGPDG